MAPPVNLSTAYRQGCPGGTANSVCAIQMSSCFSPPLRLLIAMRAFYELSLWITPSCFRYPDLPRAVRTFATAC